MNFFNMSPRRFFHLALWILVFEIVTILMGGGSLFPPKAKPCNPLIISTCEP